MCLKHVIFIRSDRLCCVRFKSLNIYGLCIDRAGLLHFYPKTSYKLYNPINKTGSISFAGWISGFRGFESGKKNSPVNDKALTVNL